MSALLDRTDLAELAPAFADPVHDAQAVFRLLLEAMSRPGRVQALPAPCVDTLGRPAGLPPALASLLLTLLDADTRLWIAPSLDTPALRAWLRFHCGTPWAAQPEEADFALLKAEDAQAALLDRLPAASDASPQDGATALVDVPQITAGAGPLRWTGPGIEHAHQLAIDGLPAAFWAWRRAQQASFPCGVDLVFAADDRVVGLPRSTRVEEH